MSATTSLVALFLELGTRTKWYREIFKKSISFLRFVFASDLYESFERRKKNVEKTFKHTPGSKASKVPNVDCVVITAPSSYLTIDPIILLYTRGLHNQKFPMSYYTLYNQDKFYNIKHYSECILYKRLLIIDKLQYFNWIRFLLNGNYNDRLPTNWLSTKYIVCITENTPNIQINFKCLLIKKILSKSWFNFQLDEPLYPNTLSRVGNIVNNNNTNYSVWYRNTCKNHILN